MQVPLTVTVLTDKKVKTLQRSLSDLGLDLRSLENDSLIPIEGLRHVLPEERQRAVLTLWILFVIDLALSQVYKHCWNAFKELKF